MGQAPSSASSPGQVERLIDRLEAEVNNGGFDQFFFNQAGDQAEATVRALETVGARKTAEIVRKACAKFPGGMPPTDRFARQELLARVSPDSETFADEDAEFLAYAEDLATLKSAYAARSI